MQSLKRKMAAVVVGAVVFTFAGAAPAGADPTGAPAANFLVAPSDLPDICPNPPIHASADFLDPTGGANVYGQLCEDPISHGYYWDVLVEDTKGDGKCAHAVADWYHKNGNHYYDYGMWVCGDGQNKFFITPTRNPTLYVGTGLGAFVDNGTTAWGAYVRTP